MKYIIDIPKTVGLLEAVGSVRYTYFDGIQVQTIVLKGDEIEELNSDYINEHYGDLQDAAYQKGLDDAWEAARKIVCDESFDWNTLLHIFNSRNFEVIFGNFSASDAVAKLKAYEEKQNDKIEVGDEVKPFYNDIAGVVTLVDGDTIYVLWRDGSSTSTLKLKEVRKTDRHFDIDKILKEMNDES